MSRSPESFSRVADAIRKIADLVEMIGQESTGARRLARLADAYTSLGDLATILMAAAGLSVEHATAAGGTLHSFRVTGSGGETISETVTEALVGKALKLPE